MQKNLERYFRTMDPVEAPQGLVDRALGRIAVSRRRSALLRHVPVLALGLCLSAGATALAVRMAIADAVQSGLTSFLSLLVTDSGSVAASWQAYGLTIVDALPVAPIAATFAALFAFFFLLGQIESEFVSRHPLNRQ